MNLLAEIEKMQNEIIPTIPKETLKVILETTQKLVHSGLAKKSLNVGDKAPSFSLPNHKGETVISDNLLKAGLLVVSFYRGGWCPYCNLELKALKEALPEIKKLGADLVAISPELPDKSLSTAEKLSLEFQVLSDMDNRVAKQFGLVFSLAEELRPIYAEFGFDIPASHGNDRYELPFPATYILDNDGSIVSAFVDADYTKRMEPEEIIKTLEILGGQKS